LRGFFFNHALNFSKNNSRPPEETPTSIFVVKDSKKYIDLDLLMNKEMGKDWKILINR